MSTDRKFRLPQVDAPLVRSLACVPSSATRARPSTSDVALERLRLLLGSRAVPTNPLWMSDDPSTVEESTAGGLREVVERWAPVGLRTARTDPAGAARWRWSGWRCSPRLPSARTSGTGGRSAQAIAPPSVVSGPATGRAGGPLRVGDLTGRRCQRESTAPGVVTVPAGARVIDVLKAAGGPLRGADLGMLNLARKVADGELVAVGVPAPASGRPAAAGGAPPPGQLPAARPDRST